MDGSFISPEDADKLGEETLSAAQYIERHLEAVILANLPEFITHESVAARLKEEWESHGRDIVADPLVLGRFVRILRALVQESVPTVPFVTLCDAFMEKARAGATLDETLEALRLLPEIQPQIPGWLEGRLFELGSDIEDQIAAGLHPHGDEHVLALRPEPTQEILSAVRTKVGSQPLATTLRVRSGGARRYVRRLVELEFPSLRVLSDAEGASYDWPVEGIIQLD
jgi:flagellar biosynthesis component FlhA